MRGDNHYFRKIGSEIFFAAGVDITRLRLPIKRSDLPVGQRPGHGAWYYSDSALN